MLSNDAQPVHDKSVCRLNKNMLQSYYFFLNFLLFLTSEIFLTFSSEKMQPLNVDLPKEIFPKFL